MTDESGRARWRRAYDRAAKRDADFTMLAAARAEATLGETCEALRTVWGSYTEPPAF
jgi:methylmalonyl-CoA mutase N-terminal domain/subunit